MSAVKIFKLGDWTLQSGGILSDAFLAYSTFGSSSSPAIIYPTWYSGLTSDNEWLIGSDKALDPSKYYIIIPALFGNSQSASPSNTSVKPFPDCTFYDNVRAQHKLVTEHLGVKHARAILGWSMGAGQTYQWITQFPDFADIAVPFCGSAKTSLHNQVFLEGIKSALLGAKKHCSNGSCKGGVLPKGEEYRTWTPEEKDVGLRALGRVYAGWGFSQSFYRDRLYETKLGFTDLEDLMKNFWEAWATSKDPEDMLAMLYTWQSGDCSLQEPYNGDFTAAMQAIKAKTLVLPCKTDLYFPDMIKCSPDDSEIEVANMKPGIGEMVAYPSIWGHWAGGPGDSVDDTKWLDDQLRRVGL